MVTGVLSQWLKGIGEIFHDQVGKQFLAGRLHDLPGGGLVGCFHFHCDMAADPHISHFMNTQIL